MRTIFGLLIVSLSTIGAANAALIDRGGGLIYDDVLNVTWLRDANYAKTSGYDADGLMTWNAATEWATQLIYGGYDDWRLPNSSPINGVAFNFADAYDGSTDSGFNLSEQGTINAGSTGNEMAYLFYKTLNNKGYCDPAVSTASVCIEQPGWGLVNVGFFTNLRPNGYWSLGSTSNTNDAWFFAFDYGSQNTANKNGVLLYSFAVRDGDVVAAAIPEPETYAMFLAGLGLIGFMVRRRKAVG